MKPKNYLNFRTISIVFILLIATSLKSFGQCWKDVATGAQFAVAVKNDGTLWYTGSLGTNPIALIPTQIGSNTDWKTVKAGHAFALMLKIDGTLWGMGYNSFGQLGDGTYDLRNTPVQIGTTHWRTIGVGDIHSLGIKDDYTLWTWGFNNYGQLGDNSYTLKNEPNQISGLGYWEDVDGGISHSMAIQNDGTIWAWGRNNYGQLGDGTTLDANYPIEISIGNETWLSISCGGNHSGAILDDGTLWTWGAGGLGQLGNGTNVDFNFPLQMNTDTNWEKVFLGINHSMAIKSDGTLWGWGHNTYGDLGIGNYINQNQPQQVETDTNWEFGSAGLDFTFVIKANDEMWSWGWNALGQLGNDSFFNQEYPTLLDCGTLSVDEIPVLDMKVFPNPTSGTIHLQTKNNTHFSVEIFDAFGKKIAQFQNTDTLDMSHLSSGLYVLKITEAETFYTSIQKIIKN